MSLDLELFREILKDDRLHIGLAIVKRVIVSDDLTSVAVECTIVPEGRDVIVTETWESVGDGTTHGDIPDPNDLLIIVMADGDPDHAYSIRRLASHEEKLPAQIKDGHFVSKSKPGKKYYLSSDTRIEIGKAITPATEPLVLGVQLMAMLDALIVQMKAITNTIITGPAGIGNLGAPVPTGAAVIAGLTAANTAIDAIKAQYLTAPTTNIASQIAYTERGV